MTDQWKPGQSEHRDTVVEKRQQRSGSGQSGRVVESTVNGVENPDEPGTDVGTAEFLAVHLDAGLLEQLRGQPLLERKIYLGGKITPALADRTRGADTGDELIVDAVEKPTRNREKFVEVTRRSHLENLSGNCCQCFGRVKRPAYNALPTIAPSTP